MLAWSGDRLGSSSLLYIASQTDSDTVRESDDFKANLTRFVSVDSSNLGNFTSTLVITDNDANKTNLSCTGDTTASKRVTICITGM